MQFKTHAAQYHLARVRPHPVSLDITVDGRNTPPLAPIGGNPPGTSCYATHNCNTNFTIYENIYPYLEPPALPTCPSDFVALHGPRGKTIQTIKTNPSKPAHDNCTPNQAQRENTSPPCRPHRPLPTEAPQYKHAAPSRAPQHGHASPS